MLYLKPRIFLFLSVTICWTSVSGVGPLISDGWTPVVGSKSVRLPPDYVEQGKPISISDDDAPAQIPQNRIDVLSNEDEEEEKPKPKKEILKSKKSNSNKKEKKDFKKPFIIYPEGTFETTSTPEPVKSAPSSKLPRRPPALRPRRPPPSVRRPPPPPRRGPPPPHARQAPQNRPRPPPPQLRPRPILRKPDGHKPLPPRGPPPSSSPGIISTIGNKIKCATEDLASGYRLSDKGFMQAQIKCVLNEGPCNSVGITIKRMAPDIMRGLCPHPCNQCKKKQIQKVMATLAKDYPYEWAKMIKVFG